METNKTIGNPLTESWGELVGISKDETIQKVDLTGKPTEEYTPYTEVPNE